jgi:hypothetical protein
VTRRVELVWTVAEIRALGARGREGRRGVHDTRRAPVEVDVSSSPGRSRNARSARRERGVK